MQLKLRLPLRHTAFGFIATALVAFAGVAHGADEGDDPPAEEGTTSEPEAKDAGVAEPEAEEEEEAESDKDKDKDKEETDEGDGETKKPAKKSAASAASKDSIHASAATEASFYYDNDHTAVLSPTIAGTVLDPVAGWSVKARYLADIVSSASVDIVSTASKRWNEVRHAGSLDLAYKPGVFGVGATGSFSSEPDYLSLVGGITGTYEFDEKNRSVLLGFVHGEDTIGRHFTPFSAFSRHLARNALNGAYTIVVNRETLVVLVGDAIYERGDQSKPYRYVPMFAAGTGDAVPAGASVDAVNAARLSEKPLEQLPLSRDRYAFTIRLLHRFSNATARISERLYADSWGVKASTTDARYIVDAGARFQLWPHLRFHTQTPAVFWKRAYEVAYDRTGAWSFPALRTGDRELSPVTAVTVGGGFRWALGSDSTPDDWALTFAADGTWTHFYDALFITDRLSVLTTLGIEAVLR